MTNFRLSRTERVCRRKFQSDENGRKFSKQVESTVGKGEIANNEQFLFPHSVFKRLLLQTRKNQLLLGKELNGFLKG